MTAQNLQSNIPNPDPSVVASLRLDEAKTELRREMLDKHAESRGWVDRLQILLEEKIHGAEDKTSSLDRVVQTRLAGSETALNAAMAAADKVTQKIEINFGAVMNEMKAGMAKQIDTIKEGIDELKGRLDRGEGVSRGAGDTISAQAVTAALDLQKQRNVIAVIVGAIGILIAIASFVYTATHQAPQPVYRPAADYTHAQG